MAREEGDAAALVTKVDDVEEEERLIKVTAAKAEEDRLAKKMAELLARDNKQIKVDIGVTRETAASASVKPEATTEVPALTTPKAKKILEDPVTETQPAHSEVIEAKIAALRDIEDVQELLRKLQCCPVLFPEFVRDFVFGSVSVCAHLAHCL